MQITYEIMKKAVKAQPLGPAEPFCTGTAQDVAEFYAVMFADMEHDGIGVIMEIDHHGSGYASYISAFLYRGDGSGIDARPEYTHTKGLLLYVSRLAPVAVFGASFQHRSKDTSVVSSEILSIKHIQDAPPDEWKDFVEAVRQAVGRHGVEVLPAEQLLESAPSDLTIPTAFDGPYYVFDTLFYWMD